MVKILNTIYEDYHMHSMNLSDGFHTIDEIVQYAARIWLKKIVITDHGQATLDACKIAKKTWAASTERRKNVYNDVEVIFGIEGDIINEAGDCCFEIGRTTSKFLTLAVHEAYQGDKKKLTQAYINALHRYHDKLKYVAHLCWSRTCEFVDVEAVTKVANQYKIPMEINAKNFVQGNTDKTKLLQMLKLADQVYVNSDMHTLSDFDTRQIAHDFLREQWFVS